MSMISFALFGLLGAVFVLLYLYDRLHIDEGLRLRLNNWTLIAASVIFVAYASVPSALVLIAVTLSTWYFAKNGKLWYIGVIAALVALGIFKYTNFIVSSTAGLFGQSVPELKILLPIGISFYTLNP